MVSDKTDNPIQISRFYFQRFWIRYNIELAE